MFVMMGPIATVLGRDGSSTSPVEVERNNNSIKSVGVDVHGSPLKANGGVEVIRLDGSDSEIDERNNNSIKHLELKRIDRVEGSRGKKARLDMNLDEIKYIDENVESDCVEVDLDGVTRVKETDIDKE